MQGSLMEAQVMLFRYEKFLPFAVVLSLLLAGTAVLARGEQSSAGDSASRGFDVANLDTTCKPCDDFYRYATGGWMARNPIPADVPSWGTFRVLGEKNREVLHQILEEAAQKRNAAGSGEQKIGDFYRSCMDTAKIEAQGLEPLQPELARIAAIHDPASLQAELARMQIERFNALFQFVSTQDFKDSTKVIGQASQGGLGLPDRDYYFNGDDRSKELRAAYEKHVAKLFELAGDSADRAAAEAHTVMTLEASLAKASMEKQLLRDPDATYHLMNLAQLKELAPDFSWESYFREIGVPALAAINVGQPDFFKEISREICAVPLDDWKIYLRWHLLHGSAPALSDTFVQEDFDFYGRKLTGSKEIPARWKRCSDSTDALLGEALGQVYVARAFPPEAKARALGMVHNLIAALRADLDTLDWMGPETRKQAIHKLDAITIKIGYPDKWRDYSRLNIDRGSYLENRLRAERFEFQRNMDKIGKPVDLSEWGMTPPTVNSYYNPQLNEIVFPAGALQPPFFDFHADDALNYGAMGAAIGHEITHGFDDQGRKFDADGNLKDWWTAEDEKNFKARAQCIEKQFDAYVVEGDLHENGKLVLSESIADFGGLTIAHAALRRSHAGKPEPAPIDGLTTEQRFFLGWAQVWESNLRPEFARLRARTSVFPLPQFRTNGPLSNMDPFAKAYSCKAADPMIRTERCKIW
jgi:putative endopeptidase